MRIDIIEKKDELHKKIRAAAYCRVSTDHDDQEDSLENQISHYEEAITSNPEYSFAGIYHDFARSGFKEDRTGFQQMLSDCRDEKIDLIITKSISRFARNTETVLKTTRELKDLGIGIFFELQGINTLTAQGELLMTIYAAVAQAESEGIRELGKMSYRRRYEAGIPVQYLERSFGYRKDDDGKFVPDVDEAKWVRCIYHMVADGRTVASVKRYLNENGVRTAAGAKWLDSTVIRLIENEIYKGDYIMHKRYVNDERKLVLNRGEVDSWYIENDHTAIVSKQLWQRAQETIKGRRAYLAEPSDVKELTEENYPYMHKLFCGYCGYPLYPRIYSGGNRLNWGCSGQKRFGKKFCDGVNVPDSFVRGWDVKGNVYVYRKSEERGMPDYSCWSEAYWNREHKKKKVEVCVLPLTKENYPYMDHIFCGKCQSKLTRHYNTNSGKVTWLCNGYKHKGRSYCTGIRIADDEIRGWMPILVDITIKEGRGEDGKKCHTYTCKTPDGGKSG